MEDKILFETIKEKLFTAVLGDVMDAVGLCQQFLPPNIRGLVPDDVIVGRAMTVQEADCFGDRLGSTGEDAAFGLMFKALDEMKAGEIYITTGSSPNYALWGGLMSTRAMAVGAVGAVLDGFHRDTREILKLGFPVFSTGSYAQDQRVRGRVIDFRCPIRFANGTVVQPGDLIVGDIDGVIVIPGERAVEIVTAALTKVEGEEAVRQMIAKGKTTQQIFAETGIM